jgi:hypothetical protein
MTNLTEPSRPPNDQRFGRESADVPPRDLLNRPRAFVGCKRLLGRFFAGRGAERALIVTKYPSGSLKPYLEDDFVRRFRLCRHVLECG